MNINENKELLGATIISCFIGIVYIMAYLIKGKDESIIGEVSVLSKALILIITAIIPVELIVIGFRNMLELNFGSAVMINILGMVFAMPFFFELMKGLSRDFNVPYQFTFKSLLIFGLIAVGALITVFLAIFTYAYISGEVTIFAPLALLIMAVAGVVTVILGRYKESFYEDTEKLKKIKKIEQKIGLGFLVAMTIFFMLLIFAYT